MTIPTNPSPNGYLAFPITVDPATLLAQALQDIMVKIPGWIPKEGHLEVVTLEEAASMMSVIAAAGTQVPMLIFMAFGPLVGINPILGVPATVEATVTMFDNAGYTIPAGTVVAYPLSGDAQVLFLVQKDLVIPPGTDTGVCTLICETVGSFPNGLPGITWQLVTTFFQIVSIVSTVDIAGGVDPETPGSYMNRLSTELQLMAPRPILPNDFAEMAQNVPGVFRACAIDGLNPGSEVTDGVTSLSSLDIGSATAHFETGEWIGRTVGDSLGHVPAGAAIASISSDSVAVLNAGHAATAAGTGDTFTFGDLDTQERCVTVCGVDSNGAPLSSILKDQLVDYLESKREVNFLVFAIDPTITEVDVSVTVTVAEGADPTATQAAVNAAITAFLDPAIWGGGNAIPPEWNAQPVVSLNALAATILGVFGVGFIAVGGLETCLHGGTLASADLTLPGDAPLPSPGTITVVTI
jgi:uncharacterized phage protein gp47/JayE